MLSYQLQRKEELAKRECSSLKTWFNVTTPPEDVGDVRLLTEGPKAVNHDEHCRDRMMEIIGEKGTDDERRRMMLDAEDIYDG